MTIDPEKLLALAKHRHHEGGVTLGWPTVLQIIEDLHDLQREVGRLQEIQRAILPCRFHGHANGECLTYSGQVPCEAAAEEEEPAEVELAGRKG